MGHPQRATEIFTDILTAYGIIRGTIKKRTKAMDMRFYWVRDQVEEKHFEVKWKPGHMKLRYYFTKNHPPTHHQSMRQTYLVNDIISVQERILRGCAKTRNLKSGEHGDYPQPRQIQDRIMTQKYGTQISWGPHGCDTTIFYLATSTCLFSPPVAVSINIMSHDSI